MNGVKLLPLLLCAALAFSGCRHKNHAPDTPAAPTGPTSGYVDSVYTFTASASDPDADSVSIRFDWGNGDTSDWSSAVPSDSPVSMAHSWDSVGSYAVRAQAQAADSSSFWSVPLSVSLSDTTPGTLRWSFDTQSFWFILSSPAVGRDGVVYFGSTNDTVYAVNPNGSLKWLFGADSTSWRFVSSPTIGADGTIYVGSEGGSLYALNANGSLRWRYDLEGGTTSSAALAADGTLYVLAFGYLHALHPDGSLKEHVPCLVEIGRSSQLTLGNLYYSVNLYL